MTADNGILLVDQMKALLGNRCTICPETNTNLLEIDHRHGDGKEDRERFKDNAVVMWTYYLKPENQAEARKRLQLLCKNHHYMKSVVAGDYSWRRNVIDTQTERTDAPDSTHLLIMYDMGNLMIRQKLVADLLWYLTRKTSKDIKETTLVKQAIKRGIFTDDFEARTVINKMTFSYPNSAWHGELFVSRPGYLQLTRRKKLDGYAPALNPSR